MARRRRDERQRDTTDIPSDPLLPILTQPSTLPAAVDPFADLSSLLEVSDGRSFHPEAWLRPPLDFSGGLARVETYIDGRASGRQARANSAVLDRPAFRSSDRSVVCARRETRREVLFARRKTGKGARSRRRRSRYSDIVC